MSQLDIAVPDRRTTTREVVETYLRRLRAGDPAQIAALFADEVDWFIPGNQDVAPWVGRRGTRQEVEAFFRLLFANVEPLRFEVEHVLVDGAVAVAVGDFASRMRQTGTVVESIFSIHLVVRDGTIVRYRLLEDSYGVVAALAAG